MNTPRLSVEYDAANIALPLFSSMVKPAMSTRISVMVSVAPLKPNTESNSKFVKNSWFGSAILIVTVGVMSIPSSDRACVAAMSWLVIRGRYSTLLMTTPWIDRPETGYDRGASNVYEVSPSVMVTKFVVSMVRSCVQRLRVVPLFCTMVTRSSGWNAKALVFAS